MFTEKFPAVEAVKEEIKRLEQVKLEEAKVKTFEKRIAMLPKMLEGRTQAEFETATRALRTQTEQFDGEIKTSLLAGITAVCDGIVVENGRVVSDNVLNLQQSESRIRDADMAKEMTEFTKNNIIMQAATAMLAQANQLPQNVLQLLR